MNPSGPIGRSVSKVWAMRKLFLAAMFAFGMWLVPVQADAGGSYYFSMHYGYPYWHDRYYRHCPRYYPPVWLYDWPPPVYYVPPPPVYFVAPRKPYCVRDEVYRYLPDGRIQWGTRTRCY